MSHSKDTLFLINRNGWQLHWDSAVSIHQLQAADLSWFGKAELYPSSAKPKGSAHTSLGLGWRFCAGLAEGCLPNLQRQGSKELGAESSRFLQKECVRVPCENHYSSELVFSLKKAEWNNQVTPLNRICCSWWCWFIEWSYWLSSQPSRQSCLSTSSIKQRPCRLFFSSKEHTPNIE